MGKEPYIKAYKALNTDGSTPQGFGRYDPKDPVWQPAIEGALILCKRGYHALFMTDILFWECPVLWEIEIKGEYLRKHEDTKLVCHTFRFVRNVETWNHCTRRLLTCDIAGLVLGLIKRKIRNQTCLAYLEDGIEAMRRTAYEPTTETKWDAIQVAVADAAFEVGRIHNLQVPSDWENSMVFNYASPALNQAVMAADAIKSAADCKWDSSKAVYYMFCGWINSYSFGNNYHMGLEFQWLMARLNAYLRGDLL